MFASCSRRALCGAADPSLCVRLLSSKALVTHGVEPVLPPCSFVPQPYTGPSKSDVLHKRGAFVHPSVFKYYKKPLMLVQGHMQYVFDETGRRYLDCFAGIVTVSVGHCHPKVTAATIEQMKLLQHSTTIYLHPNYGEFAEALAARFPSDSKLSVCYFVNSGSEANDLAIAMARAHTKNYDVIALRNCYHGMSPTAMGLTALSTWKQNIPQGFGVHHAVNPDRYRGPFGYNDPGAASKYASDVQDVIRHCTSGTVAGFIAESIQGVGGSVVLPDGYLERVYKIVRSHGGLCIADEVQTGFARMGTHYWGFETQGVVPDIVTLAKGIGNGIPLAAVVTTPEIAQSFASRIHFNTYGGNPVAMAAGRAVLQAIDEDNIQRNANDRGAQFMNGLQQLQQKYKHFVGDVRGKGLMMGVEIVKDSETREPWPEKAAETMERACKLGLVIGKGGYYGNVLRIKPVMCLTKEDVDFALQVLDEVWAE